MSLPENKLLIKGKDEGMVSRITSAISDSPIVYKAKHVVCEATDVVKKLSKSTGRVMWLSGTVLLILVVPLIIEMDRDQQLKLLNELELQQESLLGTPRAECYWEVI